MDMEKFDTLLNDAPMGGESWRHRPKRMPYDRPSEYSSVEQYLDHFFKNLTKPKAVSEFLALMEAGVELDVLVETLVEGMYGEGKINATMAPMIVPPLTVILIRMAEAAGVEFKLSDDPDAGNIGEMHFLLAEQNKRGPDNNKVNKSQNAGEKSSKELSNMPKRMGLMKRPESIV
jgi:hypothetical protein